MLKVNKIIFLVLIISLNENYFSQINLNDNQFRLAKIYEAQGELEKAKQIYQNLYNQQPTNIEYYFALNDLFLKLKDYNSSIELISNRIKNDEKNITLYGDLGSVYFIKGDENKAFEIWGDAINIDPKNPFTYKIISNYFIENRVIDKAIEILKEGSKLSEDKTIFSYDIANLYSITMQFKKATQIYCDLIKTDPKHLNIVKNRIYSYLNTNQANDETIVTVENYYEKYNDISFLELLSDLYLRTEQYDKAYKSTIELEKLTTKNGSKLFNFAMTVSRIGLYDYATNAYKEILENYKESSLYAQAEIGYAKNLEESIIKKFDNEDNWKPLQYKFVFEKNLIKDLINSYNELVKKYPENKVGWEAEYRIGLLYLYQLNDLAKADSVFQKIIDERRSIEFISPTYFELGYLNILSGNLVKAQNYFENVFKNKRINEDLLTKTKYLNAKIKMWQSKFSESINLLSEVKNNLKNKYANDALELLLILNTFKNDSLNLLLYSNADYLLEQNKFFESASEFKKLTDKENLFILKNLAELKYSQILIALNNYQDAIIFLEKTIKSDAVNIYKDRMFYLLGASYFYGLHNNEAALKYLTQFIDLFNNSIYFGKAVNIISEIKSGENNSI